MKLQSKFALYNTVSKLIIILVFVIIMPFLLRNVAVINTDKQLLKKKEQVLDIIEEVGISYFIEEDSGAYGSYNLLKEEFISLEQTDSTEYADSIEDSPRLVEEEIVDYRVLTHAFSADGEYYVLEIGRSLSTIHEIESTLRTFALITLLVISLATFLTDIAFTKHLLRPLKSIIIKLYATKDPSAFNIKPVSTSTRDFQYLDKSIHEMMKRIEDVFLKERQFISNVSHELLTPVSILQGKFENLLADSALSEEAEARLLESQKTLSRLKNITRALLLISKIENHQYLKQDSVSVIKLIDDVSEEIEDRLELKEIALDRKAIEEHVIEGCNASLLHTMLFNLINNAIKYNRPSGTIVIRGFYTWSSYILKISDTGAGIAADQMPFIFHRFKRFHKADVESFGLGLPIVKTIADFHDIKIDVVSTPGEGSTFFLEFKNESNSKYLKEKRRTSAAVT